MKISGRRIDNCVTPKMFSAEPYAVVDVLNAGDQDGWTYRASRRGGFWVIAVYDETGEFVTLWSTL